MTEMGQTFYINNEKLSPLVRELTLDMKQELVTNCDRIEPSKHSSFRTHHSSFAAGARGFGYEQ